MMNLSLKRMRLREPWKRREAGVATVDCVCAGPSVKVADDQYDLLGMPEIVILETRD